MKSFTRFARKILMSVFLMGPPPPAAKKLCHISPSGESLEIEPARESDLFV